jgi:hypothetical protein
LSSRWINPQFEQEDKGKQRKMMIKNIANQNHDQTTKTTKTRTNFDTNQTKQKDFAVREVFPLLRLILL